MRCGRYYLGVWSEQAKLDPHSFFRIPVAEEHEFHLKMKTELQFCIQEEQLGDKSKVLTLLKSCLLALKKFSLKRILALQEVKQILMD